MAESNKTTRGESNVRNFGRARPALELIESWISEDLTVFPQLASKLSQFFKDQSGADDQLKFWHVGVKQFPKWNEVLSDNTEDALDHYFESYREIGESPPAPDHNKPTGMTDPYLHSDPMSKSDWGMPFVIIHTREIKGNDPARAALVAIEHDECLRNLFDWSQAYSGNEILEWHGKRLLGLSDQHEEELRKAKKKWFIPKVNTSKPHKFKVIVSDSVVRTINWHLQETRAGFDFEVHRMDDLRRRIRSKRWPMPSALKSYRIDWPVVRNLEEAALITKRSQTALLTEFISQNAGQYVCDHLKAKYLEHVSDYEKHKYELDYCAPEPYEAEESIQDEFDKYKRVVAPFKGQVVPELNFEETTASPSQVLHQLSELQNKFSKQYRNLKKSSPELFPGEPGGHATTKGDDATVIDRVSRSPETALEDAQLVQAAMASPIPFPKTKPAIYDRVHGELGPDGVSVKTDFTCFRFVGYEITLSKETNTYEGLAKVANGYCEKHFPPSLYAMSGFDVTPKILKWANQNRTLTKNMQIICPDPRTIPANCRK